MKFAAAFFVTFYFTGTTEPVGPTIYGGKTSTECADYAADLIARIRRGQGKTFQPIEFKCAGRGK